MGKLQKNQSGFSALEAVLILVIVGILGFTGWYVWQAKQNTNKSLSTNSSIAPTYKKQAKPSTQSATYLTIKEWGVKITLSAPISNATYQIVSNNKYLPPSAFLSTATLDASTDCKSYYTKDASLDNPTPTFQRIERFALTTTTSLSEGSPAITAAQAAQQQPSTYKQIGSYVYYFGHGNGQPCQEQTIAQENAFETAFATIQAN